MTPTLTGRWQTRFFLLSTLGLLITLVFGGFYGNVVGPLMLLVAVLVLGLAWDVVYIALQRLRWNRDWPPAFAFVAGIMEGAALWLLLQALPQISALQEMTFGRFAAHYGAVFLTTFIASLGLLHLLFPRWRFNGGRLF